MTYTLFCSQEKLYSLMKKTMGEKVWRWRFWCTHGMLWWSGSLWASRILPTEKSIEDKKSIGLYRDDALAILQNLTGPQIKRKCKDFIKMFKTAGLNITIQAGLRIVNFLVVQFHLNNGTYLGIYINKISSHLPVVSKQLPKSTDKRISDENIFVIQYQYNQKHFKKVVLMKN